MGIIGDYDSAHFQCVGTDPDVVGRDRRAGLPQRMLDCLRERGPSRRLCRGAPASSPFLRFDASVIGGRFPELVILLLAPHSAELLEVIAVWLLTCSPGRTAGFP